MAQILEWLKSTNLLRHRQRAEMADDRRALEEQLAQPVLGAKAGIQNRGAITNEIRKLDKQVEQQSPRTLTPEETNILAAKKQELETEIVVGMPSQEEMRRNPPGTVHRHMQWEKANKKKLALLKNGL